MGLDAGGRGGGKRRARPKKKTPYGNTTLEQLGKNFNEFFSGGGSGQVPVQGGYAGFLQQRNKDGKSYDTSGPEPQRVAPHVTLSKKAAGGNPGDDLDALFNQLLTAVQSGSGGQVDYESALRQSEQAIREAYANDIAAIRQGNRAARKDTARDRRDMEHMYNKLAKTYQKQGKRGMRQADRLGDQMQKNSERSANFIQDQASGMVQEQAELAKGLGIEDAMPAATEGVTKEAANTANRIVKEGAQDANRQLGFGGNNRRYMQRGGQIARLEGTNRSADLLADLQDFLQGNRQQIAALKGQRGREIAENEQSVMSSVAEMQQAAQGDMFDRLMQLAGLKLDIDKEQFDQSSTLAKLQQELAGGGGDSMPGAENFSNMHQYIKQMQQPRKGAGLLEELMGSQEFMTGSYMDNKANREFKLTPYKAREMAEQIGVQNGLSQSDIELLKLAIWAQMG